jgi:hypothetical protein
MTGKQFSLDNHLRAEYLNFVKQFTIVIGESNYGEIN